MIKNICILREQKPSKMQFWKIANCVLWVQMQEREGKREEEGGKEKKMKTREYDPHSAKIDNRNWGYQVG